MKVGELANRSGLTAHTIRYYERIGLLPYALRDQSGQRDYDASILIWIEFLGRLKTTGMPIREMLRYAALRGRGAVTETARRELLEQHRERVRTRVATRAKAGSNGARAPSLKSTGRPASESSLLWKISPPTSPDI
jgi:DNA-binding transcriptional MerR regulator